MPIHITRTYEVLRASQQGDCGAGWPLGFGSVDLIAALLIEAENLAAYPN